MAPRARLTDSRTLHGGATEPCSRHRSGHVAARCAHYGGLEGGKGIFCAFFLLVTQKDRPDTTESGSMFLFDPEILAAAVRRSFQL